MKELLLSKEFEKFINATVSGKRLTASGKRISNGVIENYKFTFKLLEEYQSLYQEELRIYLLNKSTLKTLQREKNYWLKFYRQFTTFLYKHKKYFDNYVLATFKHIKTFFNYLLLEKALPVGQYHKLFKTPHQQFSPVVLSPEQLNFLITNKDFYQTLSPSLQMSRDIFVFGCTVGLRISDLMALKKTNIVMTEKDSYLYIYTKKTGTEIKIPLPDYVLQIIKKYNTRNSKYVLPRIALTNINKQLKKLAEKANWTYTVPKVMTRQGKLIEIMNKKGNCYRFCDHITAHTMRRTAITTLLILDVPELVVRKISGHAPSSKEFYRYIAIANDYTNQKVKQAHHQLLNYTNNSMEKKEIKLL